jgi:hypothetical protein
MRPFLAWVFWHSLRFIVSKERLVNTFSLEYGATELTHIVTFRFWFMPPKEKDKILVHYV